MMLREVEAVLSQIRFKDWHIALGVDERAFLQVQFGADCAKGGENRAWRGRKWYLSPHMVKSEIVQTAFKAVLTAVEHEAREHFLYRGRPIFGPHFNVDKLWSIATLEHEDTRTTEGEHSAGSTERTEAK